ncbi:MAG: EAL domain-containing protein [Bdellovibrionota bacterium]
MKILLVDDDLPSRRLLEKILSAEGHEVLSCATGESAWEYYEREPAAMAILDWMLPGMTGLDLCRKIRSHPKGRDTFVFMVTARTDAADLRAVLDAGADDYLAKPVDIAQAGVRLAIALRQLEHRIERNRVEDALKKSEQRYALAAQGANDVLWDWDLVEGRIFLSARWYSLLGLKPVPGEINPEEGWFERIHPEDRMRVKRRVEEHLLGLTDHFESEYRACHESGHYCWVLSRGVAQRAADGRAVRMAGSHTDLTMRGVHDALTGLPSRALFMERLNTVLEINRRRGGQPFALFFVDLDRFKMINDSLGHAVGDELLVATAQRLKNCIRPGDMIARLGGDEFTILLEGVRDNEEAKEIAGRIEAELVQPVRVRDQEVFSTASIGIVINHSGYQQAEELLRDADTAMYRAKAGGRARFEMFNATMREAAVQRMALVTDLRQAIRRKEFLNHYQPIVDLSTGTLAGIEALVRWNHPQRGYVSPIEFIPIAEELGLIVPLGQWVVEEACSQLQEWRQVYGEELPLSVSANLSTRQFSQGDILLTVQQALENSGLPPSSLILEITESALAEDIDSASVLLKKIRDLGVRICIDDFGTGYSSLQYLHRLPANALKVDRSFTARLDQDREANEIVRAILDLAGKFGIEVIAEGVEMERQRATLVRMGCHRGQGALFSMPLDPEQAGGMIRKAFPLRAVSGA